ncbi:MAG: hypothetical protein WC876_06840 [Candidatus Thermoplasmatota archaeon]|jgi:hypothetical protein
MHGILRPRQTLVRPSQAQGGLDLEALTTEFLGDTHESAISHFEVHRIRSSAPSNLLAGDCRTVQRTVTAGHGDGGCNGTIVAHISAPAFTAWAATGPGQPQQREAHVLAQLQLMLQDLSDHEVHGCLALTQSQCDVYDLDLVQLVTESLERTTFSHLRQPAEIHWEGTLVKSLDPPALVLVVSIDLQETQA